MWKVAPQVLEEVLVVLVDGGVPLLPLPPRRRRLLR
jgi:hypothetical protein